MNKFLTSRVKNLDVLDIEKDLNAKLEKTFISDIYALKNDIKIIQ